MSILTDASPATHARRSIDILPAVNPATDSVIRGTHAMGSFELSGPRFDGLTQVQRDFVLDAVLARLDEVDAQDRRHGA